MTVEREELISDLEELRDRIDSLRSLEADTDSYRVQGTYHRVQELIDKYDE